MPSGRWTIVTSCTRPLAAVRLRAAGLPHPAEDDHLQRKNGKPHPKPY
ncbi:MAG: hypothetical protein WCF26_24625 [Candidatus Sulfotelmatobacter sp.]